MPKVFSGGTTGNVWGDALFAATQANGETSHAEGSSTQANGEHSHAEGYGGIAEGNKSHVEGESCTASGENSHAEGYNTEAIADFSHAEGYKTNTTGFAEGGHAEGRYNYYGTIDDNNNFISVIGVGTSNLVRLNAVAVTADGRVFIKGIGGYTGQGITSSMKDIQTVIADLINAGPELGGPELELGDDREITLG